MALTEVPRLGRVRALPGPDVIAAAVMSVAGMTVLAVETVGKAVRGRPIWFGEFVTQCIFIVRSTLLPATLVNFVFGLAIVGLSAGIPLNQLGAMDRSAALVGPGLIREFGVFMTGSVFAGVMGTTITAEFGARKVREELDALAVLGVDVVRTMVVPRIAALVAMHVVVFVLALLAGSAGVWMVNVVFFDQPPGLFVPQALANVSWVDLWAGVVKVMIFGFAIGVIACFKGITAESGAEGVGRAVNESVVAGITAVFFISIVYTQFLLALYPDLTSFR